MNRKNSASKMDSVEGRHEGLSQTDKRRMAEQIGRQLRGMYDGLLNQPVPDRFMDLVSRLERDERETDSES